MISPIFPAPDARKIKGAHGAAAGEAAGDVVDAARRLPLPQEVPRPQHGKRRFDRAPAVVSDVRR